nr:MAG TPA: hypothetical protein [Caudoviricetes sp.]
MSTEQVYRTRPPIATARKRSQAKKRVKFLLRFVIS